ncbi:MAG: hypothetical protein IJ087_04390 [Eggerthellaceae bacterium]|nr:hypothetical protein [Eggerthellaceae bacterium]
MIELEFKAEGYFVLCSANGEHYVLIRENLGDSFLGGFAGARVSPVYSFAYGDKSESPLTFDFEGHCLLAFCGPYNAPLIIPKLPQAQHRWLTLGLYNLVSYYDGDQIGRLDAFKESCESIGVPWEIWEIVDGKILKVSHHEVKRIGNSWREDISQLDTFVAESDDLAYFEVLRETICELATLQDNLGVAPNNVREGLSLFCDSVRETIKGWMESDENDRRTHLGTAQKLNSSLSRFITEMFAGSSPLFETKCHFLEQFHVWNWTSHISFAKPAWKYRKRGRITTNRGTDRRL